MGSKDRLHADASPPSKINPAYPNPSSVLGSGKIINQWYVRPECSCCVRPSDKAVAHFAMQE